MIFEAIPENLPVFKARARAAALCIALTLACSGSADQLPEASAVVPSEVHVVDAFTPPRPPGTPVGAAFMTVVNPTDEDDRLVGVTTEAAGKVEMHETVVENGTMRMREREAGYPIPARGRFELRPGGAHLMLMDMRVPLEPGDSITLKLQFERAGTIEAEVPVRDP